MVRWKLKVAIWTPKTALWKLQMAIWKLKMAKMAAKEGLLMSEAGHQKTITKGGLVKKDGLECVWGAQAPEKVAKRRPLTS